MRQLLNISDIDHSVQRWSCKVMIVDKCRPRLSQKNVHYQNLIFQDNKEDQVKAIIYAQNIAHFDPILQTFHTYIVTKPSLQKSLGRYGKILSPYEWIIQRSTGFEPVEYSEFPEPLPPPTKLSIVKFSDIPNITEDKFDILGIVVACGTPKTAKKGNCQEFILIDPEKKPCLLTMWEDFVEIEGHIIAETIETFPTILARHMFRSTYHGRSITTNYPSSIAINPPYVQAKKLSDWARDNREILNDYSTSVRTLSESSSSLAIPELYEKIIAVADIDLQSTVQPFFIEAEMFLSSDEQDFYTMYCAACNLHVTITGITKAFCTKCRQVTELLPRCCLNVDLIDATGSCEATLSGEIAEELIGLSSSEVFNQLTAGVSIENKCTANMESKLFKLRVKKPYSAPTDTSKTRIQILGYTEVETIPQSVPPSPMLTSTDRGKRKMNDVESMTETHEYEDTYEESQLKKQRLEPKTPLKKK